MTTVEITVSAKKSKINTVTVFKSGGKCESSKTVMNENIAYCIEQYVSAGQIVVMSITKNGDSDRYYQCWNRITSFFNTEDCFFGNQLAIILKSAKLKAA